MRVWLGFMVLCVLSGSGWLLGEWLPETLPALLSIALRSGLLATACWVAERRRQSRAAPPLPPEREMPLVGWFILLAGLPTLVVLGGKDHFSPFTETLVFALVPVFVVFVVSQKGAAFGQRENPLRLLTPALVGLAGAAFLLPFHLPPSLSGKLWLLALMMATAASGFAAVHLHQRLAGVAVLQAARIFSVSILAVSAPLCFGLRGLFASRVGLGSGALVMLPLLCRLPLDGCVTFLTVWLLREVPPVGLSSRYPLAMSVTVTEGYLLLRPVTNWMTWLGLLLLLCSGVWLLSESREVP